MSLYIMVVIGIATLGAVGYAVVRGFTAPLTSFNPNLGSVESRFHGALPEVHRQMIRAIERTRGASVYQDEGSTVVVSTVPAIGIEGAFGLFAQASLQQLGSNQTVVVWTGMAKTSWVTNRDIQRRSLLQLERNVRESMRTSFGAKEVM